MVGSDFAARAFKFPGTSRAEELAVTEEDDSVCWADGLGGGVGLGLKGGGGGTRLVAYAAGPGEESAVRSDGCVGGGMNCLDGLGLAFDGGGKFELMAGHSWKQQLSVVGLRGFQEGGLGPASYSRHRMLLCTL